MSQLYKSIGLAAGLLTALAATAQSPIILSANITNIGCAGAYTGAIDLSVSGGVPPYNYHWSNQAGTSNPQDIIQAYAGTYCVTVTDAIGKTATKCMEITDPDCPVVIKGLPPLVSANGMAVNINPTVLGGTPWYAYKWSNASMNSQITVSPPVNTNYTITVTDSQGCTMTRTFPVEVVGSSPALAFSFYNFGCGLSGANSAVVYTYNLPPGPYTYTLTSSSSFPPATSGTFTGNTFIIDNICTSGCQFTVKVSNANGVIVSKKFGDPNPVYGLYLTSGLKITSDNPSLCPASAGTSCERVCPFTTVTYTAGPYAPLCDGTVLTNFDWTISGALSYVLNADKTEATITWGDSGAGSIVVGNQGNGCYSGSKCIDIVEIPEARMLATPAPSATDSILTVCRGQEVNFQSQSLHADLFEWVFSDDAAVKTGPQTVHDFTKAGTYSVTLIARSLCYCADTAFLKVMVLDSPAPTLNCVSAICPGESVTYSTTADCGEFHWSTSPNGMITSGGGISDDSIMVQWLDGANSTISLEVTDCADASCPVTAVIPVPVIATHAKIKGKAPVCLSSEEYYSIDAYDGASYSWEILPKDYYVPVIIDGAGTNKILVRFNSSSGKYSIIVHYNNCYLGCSGSDTLQVLIRRAILIDGPGRLCDGKTSIYFAKDQYTSLKSDWTVYAPDGSIAETMANSISITPTFSQGIGDYLLVAIPTIASQALTCTARMEWKVTVSPTPSKPLSLDGPACYCPGTVQLYTADGGFNQLMWRNSINTTQDLGNAYNLPIPADANGPLWVAVKSVANDGSGCASDTIMKWIQPMETPKISGATKYCTGDVGAFVAKPNIQGLNYVWEVLPAGAGVIVNGQSTASVEVFWTMPGTHTLKVSICNQTSSASITVNLATTPLIVHPAGVCIGETATVTAPGIWSSYSWENPDRSVLSTDPSIMLGAGTWLLSAVSDEGCAVTQSFNIVEYPKPNLTISTTDPTGFCNNAYTVSMYALTDDDAHYTYEWFQDGVPLGHNQHILSTNQYGAYSAQATNEFGCTASDGLIHVFEHCGPEIIFNNDLPPYCTSGDIAASILPSTKCDSFKFEVLPGPNYLPGSALWLFGQSGDALIGAASGDQVAYTFPNGGKYLVVMLATLQNGATCIRVDSINVEAIAHFTVMPACLGDSTIFADESTRLPDKTIDTWEWSFGDPAGGATATHFNGPVKYPYSASGPYTATLTITAGSGCTSSYSEALEIPILPQLALASTTNGCVDKATLLNAQTAGGVLQIDWDFGQVSSPANTASGALVYHYYGNTPGVYAATATATNIWGCQESVAEIVAISTNSLSGDITPPGTSNICSGQMVTLSAPAGGASYLWSNGETTASIEAQIEGLYVVTVTSASACQYVPAVKVVNVNPTPSGFIQAQIVNDLGQNTGTANSVLDVCAGDPVHLNVLANGNYQYQWSGSLGADPSQVFSEDRHNALPIGQFTYVVTITDAANGCYTVTPPFTVNVHPVPSGFSAATSSPCAGDPAEVFYMGPTDPTWELSWNNGMTGPSFTTTIPGRYIVRVTNAFGCSARSEPAILSPGPNAAAIPKGCHERCAPDTICLPAIPGVVQWQWFFNGDPIAGSSQSNFVALENGTYYAELTDSLGCKATSELLTLQLFAGTGNVYSHVWVDVNRNGIIDAADTLLSNIPVLLLENQVQVGAGASAANGEVVFAGIPASGYTVQIDAGTLNPFWEIVIGLDTVQLQGCDGKGYTDLLVGRCSTVPTDIALQTCHGVAMTYMGTSIAAGSAHDFIFTSAIGCDSIVTVTVNNLPSLASSLAVSTCPGATYTYAGVNLAIGQTQNFTLTNALGCDSIVTVTVSALPTSASLLAVSTCTGSTYTYGGVNLAVGQTQNFTLTNALGCDSIVTVTVSALPTSASSLAVSTCPGATYTYAGVDLAVGQTQDFTFANAIGCDSIVTVTVSALPASASSLAVSTCPGSTYAYGGLDLAVGETRDFTLQNAIGCDSIVTVTVNALPTSAFALAVSTCPGSIYTYAGVDLAIGQTQDFTFTNTIGCDSIVTVTVSALPTSTSSLAVSTCPGSTYAYAGVDLAVGETRNFTLQNALGCDSIVTVTVSALPTSASSLAVSTCPGSTYAYAGVDLAVGETRDFTLQNALGCDSIVTVTVSALPTAIGAATFGVCPHETYTYLGQALPAGTVKDFVLHNYLGCDSVVTITIVEKSASADIVTVKVCPGQSYTFNGEQVAVGETRSFHFHNSEGCDSLITLSVTAWPPLAFAVDAESSCPNIDNGTISITGLPGGSPLRAYAINGGTFQTTPSFENLAAGQYSLSVQDENGCVAESLETIPASPKLEIALPGAMLIPCDSAYITLTPILGGDTTGLQMTWWNGAHSLSTSTSDAGAIWLEASNHCAENLHRAAAVEWADINGQPIKIYVPNIFAPNAKNPENATFRAFLGDNLTLLDYRLEVYDRWGSLLFETEQPELGWTGDFRDKIMKPGVFVWQLWVKVAFCGRELALYKKGDVTVER